MATEYMQCTRKISGEKYPPRTLHMQPSGLKWHICEQKEHYFHIFLRIYLRFESLLIPVIVTTANSENKEWGLIQKRQRCSPWKT